MQNMILIVSLVLCFHCLGMIKKVSIPRSRESRWKQIHPCLTTCKWPGGGKIRQPNSNGNFSSPSKWVYFACFCPFLPIFSLLWRAVTFDRSKIWKFWITYLKSAKFKVSEKYNLKYFGQVEKIFIFLIFIFHLHFRILWKFLKL